MASFYKGEKIIEKSCLRFFRRKKINFILFIFLETVFF